MTTTIPDKKDAPPSQQQPKPPRTVQSILDRSSVSFAWAIASLALGIGLAKLAMGPIFPRMSLLSAILLAGTMVTALGLLSAIIMAVFAIAGTDLHLEMTKGVDDPEREGPSCPRNRPRNVLSRRSSDSGSVVNKNCPVL